VCVFELLVNCCIDYLFCIHFFSIIVTRELVLTATTVYCAMSDQHNIYDNLREDEERSEEGSVMGSDTADFFVDDEAPIRTPGTADVTDILVNTDSDVSSGNKKVN
jgi:hypothetical protein